MRTLAIGDVHGCYDALETLLSFAEVSADDLIVTLGDYVDRGPDSRRVLDVLVRLHRREQLVALRGNHELMMLDARDDPETEPYWRSMGGEETLTSYGGALELVPERHWEFLEWNCRSLWENDTHFFVHANAYPDLPLSEQPDYMLFWERFESAAPHESGKIMVCGHSSQKSGSPANLGFAVCIDTWACGRGWLTCLDVKSGAIWQAKQSGETRRLWLDEL